jgi:tRNA threonylcarbamoyladenosine biosynthesis protein TsaE
MSTAFSLDFHLSSGERTTRLGQRIAPLLRPGDTLLLRGPIGAGKTHLARSIIQERLSTGGRLEEVPSPTYTLVQTYDDGACEVWHADLYRLTDPNEAVELGLEAAFESAIVLVEWPDRLGSLAPSDALEVLLEPSGDGRHIYLKSRSDKWARLEPAIELVK